MIKNPELGIVVKQAGKVEPDPLTGQLDHHRRRTSPSSPSPTSACTSARAQRSPLITPPGLRHLHRQGRPHPLVGPSAADHHHLDLPDHSAARTAAPARRAASPPFHPGFEAGTLNNAAGAYSPFYMRLTRNDGEQEMTQLLARSCRPGVVGKLAGVANCPEAAIAAAKAKTGPHGGRKSSNPSCPAASQIGRTLAGAGVGSPLTYVPGKLYLAGPYHGDPLSVVAITPAVAGPFDLGTVVVQRGARRSTPRPPKSKSTAPPRTRSPTSSRASR